ncbi:MAG TPA: hypothetical protein VNL16_12400 [Chloroflexota bacterium]|nr:hypothetical protein [Chloroflexota bacterium]
MRFSLAQRLLAATSVILLGCCAIFGYLYLSNQSQKAALDASLVPLQATVTSLNAAAESRDASDPLLYTAAFPRDPPDLGLASAVLSSAAASGVSTGPIQTTAGGDEKIGSATYRTTTVNLTISGSLPRILNFFDRMEQAGLRTVTFDNIRLETGNGQWIAQLQIIVYAQPQ